MVIIIVMAYIVVAYIVVAYIVMTYIVMAYGEVLMLRHTIRSGRKRW